MDPRQQATMLRIAYSETNYNNLQYILTLNEHVLNDLKAELSEEEYNKIINESIVLELSDKSDEDKLLGLQVDLKYL